MTLSYQLGGTLGAWLGIALLPATMIAAPVYTLAVFDKPFLLACLVLMVAFGLLWFLTHQIERYMEPVTTAGDDLGDSDSWTLS